MAVSGAITIDGDAQSFTRLVGLFDEPDPDFAIVTP
ncbi:alkyl sulfatase C-terminal domain-containing protein [Nocardia thraciensis]